MVLLKTLIIVFSVLNFLAAILMLTRNPKMPKITLISMIVGSLLLDIGAIIPNFVPALILLIVGFILIQFGMVIYQKKKYGKVTYLDQCVRLVLAILVIVFYIVLH